MRLIDADALIAESLKPGAYNYVDTWQIANAPTIDPVRHGRWVTKRTYEHDGELYCSVCGYEPVVSGTSYCPYCGTKMDLQEKNDG